MLGITKLTQVTNEELKTKLDQQASYTIQFLEKYQNQIDLYTKIQYDGRKKEMIEVVNSQYSIQQYYYDQYKQGKMSEQQQKQQQIESIQNIRYENDNYIFILNSKGINIQHINKEQIGQNVWDLQDEKGNYIIRQIIKQQTSGDGFSTYYWEKQETKEIQPKLTFQKYFKDWDWVIQTGQYIDDIEKSIQEYKKSQFQSQRNQIFSVKIGLSSYPSVLTENGKVIMYVDPSLEGKVVSFKDQKTNEELIPIFKSHIDQIVEYYYTKPQKSGIYKKIQYVKQQEIQEFGKVLVLYTVYKDEVFQQINSQTLLIIIQLVGTLGQILFLLFIIIKVSIQNVLTEQTKFQDQLEKGNLTLEIRQKTQDEMGKIVNGLNQMKELMKKIIKNILNQSRELQKESIQVSEKTTLIDKQINTIQNSQENINQQQNNVQSSIEETTQSIEEVQSGQQNVSNLQQSLNKQQEKLHEEVQTGQKENQNILQQFQTFQKMINQQVESQSNLEQKQKQIDDILENINKIQEQTNLLQLNQQIEQQRQGDQGRGFQVVQDEIRKLQQESKQSSNNIQKILVEIKSSINSIQNISKNIETEQSKIQTESEQIGKQFNEIKQNQENLTQMNENLVQTQEEQSQQSEEIQQQMDNQSKQIKNLTEKIEHIVERISDLTKIKDDLKKQVNTMETVRKDYLENEVDKFKVE